MRGGGNMYGSYEITSKFYDKINSHIDCEAWSDFIDAVFSRYCEKKPELVLDLGCGTGALTIPMAKRGYDMTGIDISPEMLDIARERTEKEGMEKNSILWLCQDMRNFELYGTVDAVYAANDAVNYLLSSKDLDAAFSLIHNYLIPDGVLVFDFSTKGKFVRRYSGDIIVEDEGLYCGWQNYYNEKSGKVDFYLSYFTEENGVWHRYDEFQRQRAWSARGLLRSLRKNGFEPLLLTGGYDMEPAEEKTADIDFDRLYIAARVCKNENSGNNGM